MKNMFKNAYFGKPYKTRDERKAIFLYSHKRQPHECFSTIWYTLFVEDNEDYISYVYTEDGLVVGDHTKEPEWDEDIVSEWQEEINEEELEKLAEEEYPYEYNTSLYGNEEYEYKNELREAFKAGYCKAKEGTCL